MAALGKNIKCTTICPYFVNTGMFEGVRTTRLFPLLDSDFVSDRCVSAILQEEGEVSIPWDLGFIIHFIKAFVPSDGQLKI